MSEFLKDVITPLASALIGGGAVVTAAWLSARKEKTPDLHSDEKIYEVDEIVEMIGEKLGGRCDYHSGHNGTKSLSGFSFKNLSMVSEYCGPNFSSTIHLSQHVPTVVYKRNMKNLSRSKEGWIVSYESEQKDELGATIRNFGVNTFYAFKVFNDAGDWEGILTLGFKELRYDLTEECIAFVKMQAAIIGSIMSKK